jgi:hypothetical protein
MGARLVAPTAAVTQSSPVEVGGVTGLLLILAAEQVLILHMSERQPFER